MAYHQEEDSKKARVFQREKRQELQLIIERCNQIQFDYVKIPLERVHDNVVFGSSKSRKIHFHADDKTVNSFIRRCFKEHFPEPTYERKIPDIQSEAVEQKLTGPFASRVPRFQEIIVMDSSQGYRRRKKMQENLQTTKQTFSVFGSGSKRKYMHTREIKDNDSVPGISYCPEIFKKIYTRHSFGGKILIENAYEIVCSPVNLDSKCGACENEAKNVYWKNFKNQSVLCRKCYNNKILEIKNSSRGVIEKYRKLQVMQNNFKKMRHCSFYHEHSNTKASQKLLTPREFNKRCRNENYLNTKLKY